SLVTDELRNLAFWMAKETISPVISCFQAMLPSKIKPSSHHKTIKMETWVKVSDVQPGTLTAKQNVAYQFLKKQQEMSLTQWRSEF
ncbi:MAG: primosomal protein N', partial [Erysipelotrichaceae bacterium]|nr:primosomal protein N' [Erysipelotrichaceae bacterium]